MNGGAAGVALPTSVNTGTAIVNNRGVVSIDNLTSTVGAVVAAAGASGSGIPTIANVVSLRK